MVGGRLPIASLAGRVDVMKVMNPGSSPYRLPRTGTFSTNLMSLVVSQDVMKHFEEMAVDHENDPAGRIRANQGSGRKNAPLLRVLSGVRRTGLGFGFFSLRHPAVHRRSSCRRPRGIGGGECDAEHESPVRSSGVRDLVACLLVLVVEDDRGGH